MTEKPDTPEAYYARCTGEAGALALALRDRIAARAPELTCALAWSMPCYSGRERVFTVSAERKWARLQLWSGARLAERFPRIEGTGAALRHVKIRSAEDLNAELDAIMDAAVTLDREDPQRVR